MAVSTPNRVTGSKYEYAVTTNSFTTDSFAVTAGRLYVAFTSSESPPGTFATGHGDVITPSQTHSGTWNWKQVNQFYVDNGGGTWYERINVFWAIAPASSSGTLTFTSNDGSAPEDRQTVIFIESVYEFASGFDPYNPVRQYATSQTLATTHSVTLPMDPYSDSLVFGMIGDSFVGSGYTNITPPSGFTEYNEDRAGSSGSINCETAYKNGNAGRTAQWGNVSNGFGSGAMLMEIAPNHGIPPALAA